MSHDAFLAEEIMASSADSFSSSSSLTTLYDSTEKSVSFLRRRSTRKKRTISILMVASLHVLLWTSLFLLGAGIHLLTSSSSDQAVAPETSQSRSSWFVLEMLLLATVSLPYPTFSHKQSFLGLELTQRPAQLIKLKTADMMFPPVFRFDILYNSTRHHLASSISPTKLLDA